MDLQLERRAEIAFRSLHGNDQKQVVRALHDLEAMERLELPNSRKTYKVVAPTGAPVYVYRAGRRLRLILAVEEEGCTVIDIVDHDHLGRLLPHRGQQ